MGEALAEAFRRFSDAVHKLAIQTWGRDPDERAVALAEQVVACVYDCCERPLFIGFIEATAEAERSPQLRALLADSFEELRRSLAGIATEQLDAADRSDHRAQALAALMIALADHRPAVKGLPSVRKAAFHRIFSTVDGPASTPEGTASRPAPPLPPHVTWTRHEVVGRSACQARMGSPQRSDRPA